MSRRQNTLLLTGATDFLGKVVLAELLRLQAGYSVGMIILLVCRTETLDAQQCFHQAAKTGCFANLRLSWSGLVRVEEADLTRVHCGLKDEDYNRICSRVTHIIHASGYEKSNGDIHEAMSADIDGSLNILALAKDCPGLRQLVVTSTAFVAPPRDGPIYEELVKLPKRADALVADLRSHRITQSDALTLTGHPNVYTLSKCLTEHMLDQKREYLALTIVRPSIVCAALDYPSPGWVDSTAAFAGFVLGFASGGLKAFNGHRKAKLDIVPVDKVADCLIAEAFRYNERGTGRSQTRIVFSVATTAQSLTLEDSCRIMELYFGGLEFQYIGTTRLAFEINHLIYHHLRLNICATIGRLRGNHEKAEESKKALEQVRVVIADFAAYAAKSHDFFPKEPVIGFNVEGYLRLIFDGVKVNLMHG